MSDYTTSKAGLIGLLIASTLTGNVLAVELASPLHVDVASALASGDGIVLISTGAPAPCPVYGTMLGVKASKENREGRRSARAASSRATPIDHPAWESEFSDHHGFVFAFNLRPGEYDVRLGITNPYIIASRRPVAKFVVEPGKIIYLGEFFMQSCDLTFRYEVGDARSRDVAAAVKQNPAFDGPEILTRLLQLAPGD